MKDATRRIVDSPRGRWVRSRLAPRERVARAIGLPWDEIARMEAAQVGLDDLEPDVIRILDAVRPFTLTPPERIAALCAAVDYVVASGLEGAIAECGVWKGGSLMASAMRLQTVEGSERELVGFDTFSGMTDPTDVDVDHTGVAAQPRDAAVPIEKGTTEPEVRETLRQTGYDLNRIRLIPGDVAETIPAEAPEKISVLRLDTDWYESTRHELEHLFPRLVPGGVVIIDDYGHFAGARKATDEYFAYRRMLLHRIDYASRLGVKQEM